MVVSIPFVFSVHLSEGRFLLVADGVAPRLFFGDGFRSRENGTKKRSSTEIQTDLYGCEIDENRTKGSLSFSKVSSLN